MMILQNVRLKKYNTFGLDYTADRMIRIKSEEEAMALFNGSVDWEPPLLILGGGSNILFTCDFNGTIIFPEIKGIRLEETEDDKRHVIVSAGAGVEWDEFVAWTVGKGFGGLENLSLIPGNAGATPIQNIGAYGVEVRDSIVKVRAVSTLDGTIRLFSNEECEFGYRNSIFKNNEKGKYLVTRVYYRLAVDPAVNLSYGSLKEEVARLGPENPENVRQAVINIRTSKLPDPKLTGNAGSFFKNPVVPESFASAIKKEFPSLPVYNDKDGYVKLAAGWLIEQCGWKGKRTGNAGVHDKQALVLINYGNATGKEIYDLSSEIRKSVMEKFGIELEREVEIAGTI
jgi:UDP-N-acetylmuramate dehydrogenase